MNSVERVKLICKERKIPISRLERDLGYANGYIGQLRKGVFPDDRLVEIASYLSISTNDLLTGEEKEKAPSEIEGGTRDYIDGINKTIHAEYPISILASMYGVSSEVMADILGVDHSRAEKMILQLEKPEDQQLQKAANVFRIPFDALKAGIIPLRANSEVVLEVLNRTFDRYPRH